MTATGSEPQTATDPILQAAVRELMHVGLLDCSPQTPMLEVARRMAEGDVHCIVVDGLARGAHHQERLVWGIVSDLDLAAAVAAGRLEAPAEQFAASEPVAIGPDEDLHCAARLMAEHECSHLIVIDDQTGRPVGMLSTLDLARALQPEMPATNERFGR